MTFLYLIICALLAYGLWLLCASKLFRERSFSGRRTLRTFQKWQAGEKDVWANGILRKLTDLFAKLTFLAPAEEEKLGKQLNRAGLDLTARQYAARKLVLAAFGVLGALLCALARFWFGILLAGLLAGFLIMKQRELLSGKLKEKDDAVALEMPRFVRTVCRNLRTNRDVTAALSSYRKVAGPELGAELDILLAHLRTGGVAAALQQFQKRLGTEEAFRLCATLQEIDRGIDQTATLDILADDMARQSRYRIERSLATRPAKMRRTYLPAVGICVVMILYVLIVFVTDSLNSLF